MSEEYKVKLMQFEQYQSRLEGLKAEYEAGSQELDYTDNQAKRKRLEREQNARYKEMEQVAQQYDQCATELRELAAQTGINLPAQLEALASTHQLLVDLLTPHLAIIKKPLEAAYRAACPTDWLREIPKTLKGMVIDLKDMPLDEQGYSPTFKFVAGLVMDTQIQKKHEQLCHDLQEWAEQNIQDFSEVLQHVQQSLIINASMDHEQPTHSYLMVVLERSGTTDQQKEPCYFVKAWFILDGQTDQPTAKAGFEALTIPGSLEDAENAFTFDEIEGLLRAFLDESSQKCLSQGRVLENLTIELFLPSELLNNAVDCWVIDDGENWMGEPIGFQHRIVVRSSDRLRDTYLKSHRAGLWRDKWNRVRQMIQARSDHAVLSNAFVSGDGVVAKRLFQQLSQPQMIGLKLAQESLSIGKESTFAALHSSATPIAIWLRQSLSSVDCIGAVDELLHCCIHEIPEQVRQNRQAAFPEECDCHIGHHLALLWEDFDRLPPDLDYQMA